MLPAPIALAKEPFPYQNAITRRENRNAAWRRGKSCWRLGAARMIEDFEEGSGAIIGGNAIDHDLVARRTLMNKHQFAVSLGSVFVVTEFGRQADRLHRRATPR